MKINKINIIFIIFISLINFNVSNGKVYTRCELARELKRQGMDRTFLSNWVCLVESESGRDPHKISNINSLYTNYGLFQISNKEYCNKITKGGLCNVKCDSLVGDNVTEAARCAKIMFRRDGFKGWKGWEKDCKKKTMPEISHCFTI